MRIIIPAEQTVIHNSSLVHTEVQTRIRYYIFTAVMAYFTTTTHHLTLYTEAYSVVKSPIESFEDSSKEFSAAMDSALSELLGVLGAISTLV